MSMSTKQKQNYCVLDALRFHPILPAVCYGYSVPAQTPHPRTKPNPYNIVVKDVTLALQEWVSRNTSRHPNLIYGTTHKTCST